MKPTLLTATGLLLLTLGHGSMAQAPATDPAAHGQTQSAATSEQSVQDLAAQIADLSAKVGQLQSAVMQANAASSQGSPAMAKQAMGAQAPAGGMPGMPAAANPAAMMDDDMPMAPGMMDDDMPMAPGMMDDDAMAAAAAMPMMDQMEMMGMSRMGAGMQGGSMSSALPGFPGASHLYHIGAAGFFLDHPQHITLSLEQQQQIAQIKEATLLKQAEMQRGIEQVEQELWVLTGSDSPDANKIEAKIAESGKLKAEQRMAFITAVGKAAELLTDQQRMQLTGLLPPAAEMPAMPAMPAAMPDE